MRLAFTAVLALVLLSFGGNAFAEDILVIVHKDSGASLSTSQAKALYLGKERSIQGHHARVYDRSGDGALRRGFLRKLVGASEREFDRYWIAKSYRDGASPPQKLGSGTAVVQAVASSKGAVGYIRAADLPEGANVKVVARLAGGTK